MILVTTAGKVGAEAARLLAGQAAPVRILSATRRKRPRGRRARREDHQRSLGRLAYRAAPRPGRDRGRADRVPGTIAEDNARALSLFARGDADYVTDDVPTLLGRPARTFEQFAADYSPAFSKITAATSH